MNISPEVFSSYPDFRWLRSLLDRAIFRKRRYDKINQIYTLVRYPKCGKVRIRLSGEHEGYAGDFKSVSKSFKDGYIDFSLGSGEEIRDCTMRRIVKYLNGLDERADVCVQFFTPERGELIASIDLNKLGD